MTQSALNQLKQFTTIVADSSDLVAIEKFRPLDATTNPSLITAAANQAENKALIEDAYTQAKAEAYVGNELIERTIDILTVKFGVEILKLIEGQYQLKLMHPCLMTRKRRLPKPKNCWHCMHNTAFLQTAS